MAAAKVKTVKVKVTSDDIAFGKKNNKNHCPAARAIVRTLEEMGVNATRPMVDKKSTRVSIDGKRLVMPTPLAIANRLDEWDTPSGRMEPFGFVLDVTKAKVKSLRTQPYTRVGNPRSPVTKKPGAAVVRLAGK